MGILYRIKGIRKIVLVVENLIFNLVYRKRLGNRVSIFGFPLIFLERGSQISVGKGVTFCSTSYFNEPGVNHPVMIRLLSNEAKLILGNNVGISGGGISVQEEVILGDDVLLGANTFITDTDFHPIDPEIRKVARRSEVKSKKVVIGDNVFIGMNSIILKGVSIGENSVIGAGSVVAKSIPANQIWAGNPAKFIREI